MDKLYNHSSNWKYVMSLTGQEYPLKSNLDIVKILTAVNGSNVVMTSVKRFVDCLFDRPLFNAKTNKLHMTN